MTTQPVGIGIVGCGAISGIYCKICSKMENLKLLACADMIGERAEAKAAEFGIANVLTVEQLLADERIEIVLNLTIPKAHAEIALAAVAAGKSVYNEKPLTVTRQDGTRLLAAAAAKGVRVGGAPDTFLGAAQQTCRKLIADGAIGRPVAATAFMMGHGHESWHADPEFFYKTGGGPMFDMGPYYLTSLINLIGPIRRVTGSTRISFDQRTITSEPKSGTVIDVEVPTHIAGVMDFADGAVGTIITSFDIWGHHLPCIEVHGTEGSLSVPDPNCFGGTVQLRRAAESEWADVPLSHPYAENSRGLGVADMAAAIRSGRPHRASGELTYHVLDVMHAFHDASDTGEHATIQSTCPRPAPMPTGLAEGTVDE